MLYFLVMSKKFNEHFQNINNLALGTSSWLWLKRMAKVDGVNDNLPYPASSTIINYTEQKPSLLSKILPMLLATGLGAAGIGYVMGYRPKLPDVINNILPSAPAAPPVDSGVGLEVR